MFTASFFQYICVFEIFVEKWLEKLKYAQIVATNWDIPSGISNLTNNFTVLIKAINSSFIRSNLWQKFFYFNHSVQLSHSVMCNSLWPHGLKLTAKYYFGLNSNNNNLWKCTYLVDKHKAVPPSSKFCIAYRIFSLWY